jgi:hypothetical protein
MVMQAIASGSFPQSIPSSSFLKNATVDTEAITMAKSLFHEQFLPISAARLTNARRRKARQVVVVLLGLALVVVSPQVGFGQSAQQQEQQQREQQAREQQAREQQAREQQAREQQQRDQQQREQQAREQQQREQQAREQQQRDQQQREQQAREQQQRDQQREQQERTQQQQHSSSDSPVQTSNESAEDSRPAAARPPATDVKRTSSEIQPVGVERKINSAPVVNATVTKNPSTPVESPTPVQPKPVASVPPSKRQPCPAGQSEGKDGSCAAPHVAKNGVVKNAKVGGSSARNAVQQPCPGGQVWNGAQCAVAGLQPCLPGQSGVGTSCHEQPECTIATATAQNYIVQLRSARQKKDEACLGTPTAQGCQEAETHYNVTLNEYRSVLGGVPLECQTMLPDPTAI